MLKRRKKSAAVIIVMDISTRDMLFATVSLGMLFLNMFTRTLFLIRLQANLPKRASVVVFIPPPQEPGEAPTYIKNIINARVALLRVAMSMVLNPAVRQVMDWKKELKKLPTNEYPCIEAFCSMIQKTAVPVKINMPVVIKTVFV